MFKFLKKQPQISEKPQVIVTGGAGFIGSNLAKALLEDGFSVHIIDNLSSGSVDNIPTGAILHIGDIRHLDETRKIFKKIRSRGPVEYVFHLAAIPEIEQSFVKPLKVNEVNVIGTDHVLCLTEEIKAKRFIFSSSCSVYGNTDTLPTHEKVLPAPTNPYAFHKQIGENYCGIFNTAFGLSTVALRYFNVYGPNQRFKSSYSGVISVFLEQKKLGKNLTVTGTGKQTRDFIHVSDVVRANILAAKSDKIKGAEVINIGSGYGTSILEIAGIIGGSIDFIESRKEIVNSKADITKALMLLDWKPQISIKEGLRSLKKIKDIS